MILPDLPVAGVLPELSAALDASPRVVLKAPPGAGKTTLVPLALLPGLPRGRGIVMLEPRRMAARAAAARMASLLGEPVGRTVGYRIRLDRRASAETRILVVTEGILTRMLRDEPDLPTTSLLIFDEFHERSIHADTGLALALDCQETLRDGDDPLSVLVMSATLETGPLAALLGGDRGCPVVVSEGRLHPVETEYLPPAPGDDPLRPAGRVCAAVRRALAERRGDVLAFLPGGGDVRAAAERLADLAPEVAVRRLYGDLPPEEQDAAVAPDPDGRRKVVLATNIAESSLSIPGVRIVIDSGLERRMRFDSGTGMGTLATGRISMASADQRRGRAGRFGPGVCYRLWHRSDEQGMQPFARPEILDADLADLRLELALWGVGDPAALRWLDPPPGEAWSRATALLTRLGVLREERGRHVVTPHGKAVSAVPLHPRLAHMLLRARDLGLARVAAAVAAVLEDRGARPDAAGRDIRARLGRRNASAALLADRLSAVVRPGKDEPGLADQIDRAGAVLALAYPERVAMRRPNAGRGEYLTASGKGAALPVTDALADAPFLAVGAAAVTGATMDVSCAAPLTRDEIGTLFGDAVRETSVTEWDDRQGCVVAERRVVLGALVLERCRDPRPDPLLLADGVVRGIRAAGLACLPWTEALTEWRARVQAMRCVDPASWPDVGDAALTAGLGDWLAPYLAGVTRRAAFGGIPLADALRAMLGPDARDAVRTLDRELPASIAVPSGSVVRLAYDRGVLTAAPLPALPQPPVLAVKLQELFGLTRHPAVLGGRLPVRIHLLSPAGRPLQITQDIAGFWRDAYPMVRAEMRGRYPRHPWPEDPLSAVPTRKAKNRA